MDTIYVIYKDGERMTISTIYRNIKVAYLTKGRAKQVITTLVNSYVSWELNISAFHNKEKWEEEVKKEFARYEIKEYIPKEG